MIVTRETVANIHADANSLAELRDKIRQLEAKQQELITAHNGVVNLLSELYDDNDETDDDDFEIPIVEDRDLDDNEARVIDGAMHVGSRWFELWDEAQRGDACEPEGAEFDIPGKRGQRIEIKTEE